MSSDNTKPAEAKRRPRVLIVEDEYFIAMELAESLRSNGAEAAEIVGDLEGAMDAISRLQELHGAVLDLQLRRDHAWSVAVALQARGIPFVIATGYGRESVPDVWRHIPIWQKPFEADTLVKSLLARIRNP